MNTDVVIIGGGPVGCFLALLLDDMGVSNVVIERDEKPYTLPRAIVMDDEIQRAAHDHGLGTWLQSNTSRLERGDFLAPDGTVAIGADIPPMGLQGVPPVVVKGNVPSPPTVFFTMVNLPCFVLLKVQVMLLPATTWILAVWATMVDEAPF